MNNRSKPLYLKLLVALLGFGTAVSTLPGLALTIPTLQLSAQHKARDREISQTFIPPNRGTPKETAGGATRGGCDFVGDKVIALVPKTNYGLTLSNHPTFYWFVPKIPLRDVPVNVAQFVLLDERGDSIFETAFALNNNPGIIGFTPTEKTLNLEIGKPYHWFLNVYCGSEESEIYQTVDGWIERTKGSPELSQKVKTATTSQLSSIYAGSGIWYDALDNLIHQRCTAPEDERVKNNWRALLVSASVGLDDLVSKSLVDVCTSESK